MSFSTSSAADGGTIVLGVVVLIAHQTVSSVVAFVVVPNQTCLWLALLVHRAQGLEPPPGLARHVIGAPRVLLSPESPPLSSESTFSAESPTLPCTASMLLGAPVAPDEASCPLPDVQAEQDQLFFQEEMDKPANTWKAIVPKVLEWQAFIDHIIQSAGDHPDNNLCYIPNKDNMYNFYLTRHCARRGSKMGSRSSQDKRMRTEEALIAMNTTT
jgi:hypothetical protein